MAKIQKKYNPEIFGLKEGFVSVVLPVYNQANLIQESIDSVLNQSYKNFELIIINDGSTDGVEDVLVKYLDRPNIRIYTQINQKLPKALSNGFDFAVGEYWTWTSADNIMMPNMLELMVKKLKSDDGLCMVYADYLAIDDRGASLADTSWRAHNRPVSSSPEIRLPRDTKFLNKIKDNFVGPCFMYRGWIGKLFGDYDTMLGVEDYDYWMRINNFFRIEHIGVDDLLYKYRVHDNTLSANAEMHNIYDKANNLMAYEASRSTFNQKKLRIHVDNLLGNTISNKFKRKNIEIIHTDWNVIPQSDVFIIDAINALKISDELIDSDLIIGIHFDSDIYVSSLDLSDLLARKNIFAIVSDKITSKRIRIDFNGLILDVNSVLFETIVFAFSKNRLFIESTRAEIDLSRSKPLQLSYTCKENKNILLILDNFVSGGLENVVIDLSIYLNNIFNVTILVTKECGSASEIAKKNSLTVIHIDEIGGVNNFKEWLMKSNISLVNFHCSTFQMLLIHELGIPIIQTIHNSYVWFSEEDINNYKKLDRFVTHYICVSKSCLEYAIVNFQLDLDKFSVIENGINIDKFSRANLNKELLRIELGIPEDAAVIVNVASILPSKAQLPLIRAFKDLLTVKQGAILYLIGPALDSHYQLKLIDFLTTNNLQASVKLLGQITNVEDYLNAADLFVLPSFWEGWSLALAEAYYLGLPCVITKVGSSYEFSNYNNVYVVDPPFKNITNLNYTNLEYYLNKSDEIFEAELTAALISSLNIEKSVRIPNNIDVRKIDRRSAYASYVNIFKTKIKWS
jgi:glycosyltransferase involved in cell wall biosynthesis